MALKSDDWTQLLAAMASTQDKSLYVALYRHFAPKVKGYIIRLGITESTAEELAQETMLSMWRKAHLFDPRKSAASTWVYTLARNQSIDWMRRRKYPEYSIDATEDMPAETQGAVSYATTPEQSASCEQIIRVIEQLPEKQSQVIYMSFFEGKSHAEIADQLMVPLGSVKSRIRLAVEKLKSVLRGHM
jgi:RNA polymerase sigma-70 factor (ECF subfamily)